MRTYCNYVSKMAHLPQPGIFFEKPLIYVSRNFRALLFWEVKKFLGWIQSYKVKPFSGPKWPTCLKYFFGKTINLIFMCLLVPFIMQNFKKKSLEWIQSYDDVSFSRQNGPFAPNENFFKKTINVSFMCLLASFIVQNFKSILRVDLEL